MQTRFPPELLADPRHAAAEAIVRKCVHCGLCTATCPTYVTLGNELDSPRGRIYLIKDMLENGRAADSRTMLHLDRCLTCLACTTTCPSGVDYARLIDLARQHVERTGRRPLADRALRGLLAVVLPYPRRFRTALRLSAPFRFLANILTRNKVLRPIGAMLALAPASVPANTRFAGTARPSGEVRARVALMAGCAQSVLDPAINAATVRLLNRLGVEVVHAAGEGCCGALVQHMGRETSAQAFAAANVRAWMAADRECPLDAVIVTASGCGTTVKDYGHLLADRPDLAADGRRIASLAADITEFLARLDLPAARNPMNVSVTYHAACSLQHGQKVTLQPKALLAKAGFTVKEPREPHLCCGSAGVYNILQSEIAGALKARKVRNLEAARGEVIAAGNIGCLTQIRSGTDLPVLHTVQLLDWAYGGPAPEGRPARFRVT